MKKREFGKSFEYFITLKRREQLHLYEIYDLGDTILARQLKFQLLKELLPDLAAQYERLVQQESRSTDTAPRRQFLVSIYLKYQEVMRVLSVAGIDDTDENIECLIQILLEAVFLQTENIEQFTLHGVKQAAMIEVYSYS